MVRGHGRDRIQVYARIVHQLTSERMKPIPEQCVCPPTRQQKEPFNAILTRPGSYKSIFQKHSVPRHVKLPYRQQAKRTLAQAGGDGLSLPA